MLGVRPKHDATNGYRTDTRMPYLLKSDTMITRERIIWKKKFHPPPSPREDSGRKTKKNKKLNSMNRTQKTPDYSRCFFGGLGHFIRLRVLTTMPTCPPTAYVKTKTVNLVYKPLGRDKDG